MFMNPFPLWYIIFVVIPVNLLCSITYLPYFILKFVGLGKFYKKIHYFVWVNVEQFTLDPKHYCKHIKDINIQIINDCKKM